MPLPERTRVLQVITRLVRGGADEQAVTTVNELSRHRYTVELLVGGESELKPIASEINDVHVITIPELVRNPHPWRDLVALVKMVRLLKKRKYDIVHTNTAKAGFIGRWAAHLAGVPTVVHTIHGITFPPHLSSLRRMVYIFLERVAARWTHVMIAVGNDMKTKYLAAGIGTPDQYVIIPSGMNTSPFHQSYKDRIKIRSRIRKELGLNDDQIVVGMIARLEKRKGFEYFLQVAHTVCQKYDSVRFLIVGEGPERTNLEQESRRLGTDHHVKFAGFRSDIADVISSFDIAALTSLWEGLPRVLVQYSLSALPIVTFDVDGAREIVEDGLSGYVVPMKDTEAMSKRVIHLIEQSDLRKQFGQAVRKHVGNRWDASTMIRQVQAVYESRVPGSPRSMAVGTTPST